MWVWDFSGQKEFHPLQDFIFPNATSVHAATAFVFTFNPLQSVQESQSATSTNNNRGKRGVRYNRWKLKQQQQFDQEFFYWLKFICSNSTPRHMQG